MTLVKQLLLRGLFAICALGLFSFGQAQTDGCAECQLTAPSPSIVNLGRCQYGFVASGASSRCPYLPTVWSYGDGSPNTTGAFGSHTYTSPGVYIVCVTFSVTGPSGVCSVTNCITVTVPNCNENCGACTITPGTMTVQQPTPCLARITMSGSSSACPLVGFRYSFGDGTGLNTTSPFAQHSYNTSGSYTICVTEIRASGNDTCTYTYCQTIQVIGCNVGCKECEYQPGQLVLNLGGQPCQVIAGVNASSGTCAVDHYEYDFGDGTTFNSTFGLQPHFYTANGTYTVCVTEVRRTGNTECRWTYCGQITVTGCTNPCEVCPITPGTLFTQFGAPCVLQLWVSGSSSPCAIDHWEFDYGDGSAVVTSGSSFGTHTYTSSGTFTVCVTEVRTNGQVSCRRQYCRQVVVTGCQSCTTDSYEPDNTLPQAHNGGSSCAGFQWNDFCISQNDRDITTVLAGQYYIVVRGADASVSGKYNLWYNCVAGAPRCLQIETLPFAGSSTNTVLELYETATNTLVASDDDGGAGLFSRIDYCLPQKAANIDGFTSWKIYPTVLAAGSSVQYELPSGLGNVALTLMDATGRQVQGYDVIAGKGSFKLPETVAPGMYFVRTNQTSLATLRLIVQ